MWSRHWWKHTLERMIKTAAQVFATLVPTSAALLDTVNWGFVGISVLLASAMSLATSILTTPFGPDGDNPSAV